MEAEQPLSGGNASGRVVRVGGTVRKSWTAATPGVHAYLRWLRAKGVEVPLPRGRDRQGRQALEHIPGTMASDRAPLSLEELARVGGLVRQIHEASVGFPEPPDTTWECAITSPGRELMCHNDLAPWNLVVGERWVFIDWDAAGPSTRLWDLAYAAQAFTLDDPEAAPEISALRLRAFVDGYGADDDLRRALPATMVARTRSMVDLLATAHAEGREPWASMHATGHGAHWSGALSYVERNAAAWHGALGSGQ